ncbi:HNH endonuclease [Roseomonas sp. BN140053]|uniref:HNH endonuclease n=1 Tax=Roseomonas sp. BN140053 TaxID=3391898 RepID=UPI0039E8BC82
MIKLTKQPEPQVLRDNGPQWLKVLQDRVAASKAPTSTETSRYNNPEIKAALRLETHDKCAYCESCLTHITYGDIDHISPKSVKLEDTFRWSNLTLACDVCNTKKGKEIDIVDPYIDEPNDLFRFAGAIMFAKPNKGIAKRTLHRLDLNRTELMQRRVKRLNAIWSILHVIEIATDPLEKQAAIDELFETETADSAEYAASVRQFLAHVAPHLQATTV